MEQKHDSNDPTHTLIAFRAPVVLRDKIDGEADAQVSNRSAVIRSIVQRHYEQGEDCGEEARMELRAVMDDIKMIVRQELTDFGVQGGWLQPPPAPPATE